MQRSVCFYALFGQLVWLLPSGINTATEFGLLIENCFNAQQVPRESIEDWVRDRLPPGTTQSKVISCGSVSEAIQAVANLSGPDAVDWSLAAMTTASMATMLKSAFTRKRLENPVGGAGRVLVARWVNENECPTTTPATLVNEFEAEEQQRLFLLRNNASLYPVLEERNIKSDCEEATNAQIWSDQLQAFFKDWSHFGLDKMHHDLAVFVYETGRPDKQDSHTSGSTWKLGEPHTAPMEHSLSASDHFTCRAIEDNICTDRDEVSKRFYRVGAIESPPFLMFDKDQFGGETIPKGLVVDILDLISTKLKFNYTLVLQKGYGNLLADGTWNGAIGALLREEIDMIAADLSLTPARARLMDFTVPFMQGSQVVVIRAAMQDTSIKDLLLTHLRPFHWSVWLVMGVCWIVATGLLTTAEKPKPEMPFMSITEGKKKIYDEEPEYRDTWWAVLFQLLGLVCQQGCNIDPNRLSGKVILLTFCVFALASYNFYTSVFISFTTVSKSTMAVDNLAELLKDSSFKVGYVHSDRIDEMFRMATLPIYQRAWRKMQRGGKFHVNDVEEGISRAFNEKFAFIGEFHSMEWYVKRNCSFVMLNDRLLSEGFYFALPLNSPDTVIISKYIKRLLESGMVSRLRSNHMPDKTDDFCVDTTTLDAVGLESMAGLFLCLALGVGFAILSLGLERVGNSQNEPIKRLTIVVKSKPRF